MAILIQAQFHMLTYGTYGMWGALLSHSKTVLMPSGYERNDVTHAIAKANMTGWKFV